MALGAPCELEPAGLSGSLVGTTGLPANFYGLVVV